MNKIFLTGLFVLISFFTRALSQSVNVENSYSVSGTMHRQVLLKGKVIYSATNKFEVNVSGCSVKIHSQCIPNGDVKDSYFITDGKESRFITTRDNDPELVEKSQAPGGNQIFSAFVYTCTNAFPPNDSEYIGPIWIATSSGCILKNQGEGVGYIYPCLYMSPNWPDFGGEQLRASCQSLLSHHTYLKH